MYDKGDIYLDKYEGLYCQGCEQFKNEKDLVDGKCPDHLTMPEKLSEETYMFKMRKYTDAIVQKIEKDEFRISPIERKNEIISFYKDGLNDVSFSRKNVKWGVPLPWDNTHTAYVWSDAFLNYLTVLDWCGPEQELSSGKLVQEFWPPDVQLMSKDILRVHATIWPAMLISLGMPLPKELFVHGFFQIDGQKMSKSLGNVISPDDLVEKYGVDATRYLLMSATVFGRDGDISWEKFDLKYTADLANGLGNLVARTSNLIEKNEIEMDLKAGTDSALATQVSQALENYHFDEALDILWSKLREMDELITLKAPWKMTDKDEITEVLKTVAQNILNVADLLLSFMPDTAEKILVQFTAKQIKKGESLFPRLA
jgi:methionyl-tRNA synthetase